MNIYSSFDPDNFITVKYDDHTNFNDLNKDTSFSYKFFIDNVLLEDYSKLVKDYKDKNITYTRSNRCKLLDWIDKNKLDWGVLSANSNAKIGRAHV